MGCSPGNSAISFSGKRRRKTQAGDHIRRQKSPAPRVEACRPVVSHDEVLARRNDHREIVVRAVRSDVRLAKDHAVRIGGIFNADDAVGNGDVSPGTPMTRLM